MRAISGRWHIFYNIVLVYWKTILIIDIDFCRGQIFKEFNKDGRYQTTRSQLTKFHGISFFYASDLI